MNASPGSRLRWLRTRRRGARGLHPHARLLLAARRTRPLYPWRRCHSPRVDSSGSSHATVPLRACLHDIALPSLSYSSAVGNGRLRGLDPRGRLRHRATSPGRGAPAYDRPMSTCSTADAAPRCDHPCISYSPICDYRVAVQTVRTGEGEPNSSPSAQDEHGGMSERPSAPSSRRRPLARRHQRPLPPVTGRGSHTQRQRGEVPLAVRSQRRDSHRGDYLRLPSRTAVSVTLRYTGRSDAFSPGNAPPWCRRSQTAAPGPR